MTSKHMQHVSAVLLLVVTLGFAVESPPPDAIIARAVCENEVNFQSLYDIILFTAQHKPYK